MQICTHGHALRVGGASKEAAINFTCRVHSMSRMCCAFTEMCSEPTPVYLQIILMCLDQRNGPDVALLPAAHAVVLGTQTRHRPHIPGSIRSSDYESDLLIVPSQACACHRPPHLCQQGTLAPLLASSVRSAAKLVSAGRISLGAFLHAVPPANDARLVWVHPGAAGGHQQLRSSRLTVTC